MEKMLRVFFVMLLMALTACGDNAGMSSEDVDSDHMAAGIDWMIAIPEIDVTDSVAPGNDLALPFGVVTVGSAGDETVTVTNSGSGGLAIGTVGSANPLAAPFSIVADNCSGQTLAPAASCTLTVRFSPVSDATSNDTFDIPSNDIDESSVTVSVSGTGSFLLVPDIAVTDSVSPDTDLLVPFGSIVIGNVSNQTVTVTNKGTANLVLGTVGSTNGLLPPFSITSDACSGQTLAPSASCAITVRFAPASTGAFSDAFSISSSDPDESLLIMNVSGTGAPLPAPNIAVVPAGTLNFGHTDVGNPIISPVTVYNNGSADLVIGSIAAANPLAAPFSIVGDGCSGKTLSPSAHCVIMVWFEPTAGGSFVDYFNIPSNDPDQSTITMKVMGRAGNVWRPTSTTGAPSARQRHTAVWTGGEMIVWGDGVNTGGIYDPATDSWRPTSTSGAPSKREDHTAVWTGVEMIIWGGSDLNTGGRYDPTTDSWRSTSTSGAPAGRTYHTAVWTGKKMIVWGGCATYGYWDWNKYYSGIEFYSTGGMYDPVTNTWQATNTAAPSARVFHTAVWTGKEMIVWGGHDYNLGRSFGDGGRYDPSTNTWTLMPLSLEERYLHSAVWTGTEMIVWGGYGGSPHISPDHYLNNGGRYNPSTGVWRSTSLVGAPSARQGHTAVFIPTDVMVVWGGLGDNGAVNTGGRYYPSTDTWQPTKTIGAPSVRYGHTSVITNTLEMIVWGGNGGNSSVSTGGVYRP